MFKQLTLDNWDVPDPTGGAFVRLSPETGVESVSGADWVREFLAVELAPAVPMGIHQMVAVARGALIYGWFFYPLYMLGQEQLYRVADSSIAIRYRALKGLERTERVPSFHRRITGLAEALIIPDDLLRRWQAIRKLRNIGSHPEIQMLQPPGVALDSLRIVVASVNALFEEPDAWQG